MLKSRAFVALLAILTVAACSSFAVAPEQLQWRDLVNHPERWPASTTIKQDMRFTESTLPKGTSVQVFKVLPNEVQLLAGTDFLFAANQDECNLLADANAFWSTLSPAQKELTWQQISKDRSLWPDKLILTSTMQYGQIVLDAGEEVDLICVQGNEVSITHAKLESPLLVGNTDTDIFAQARKLVGMPEEERPGFIPAIFARRTVDVDGKPVTLEPARYYVIYYAASTCPRCEYFSPKLVDYYNQNLAERNDVKFIVWSTERPKSNIQGYMKKYGMPWSTLTDEAANVVAFAYRKAGSQFEIPGIQVIDRFGNELLATNKISGQPIAAAEVALSRLKDVLVK